MQLIFTCQDLVDIDVFQEAKKVIDALQNKEVAPALAWCSENKSRLKKSKVRTAIFQFISMVKRDPGRSILIRIEIKNMIKI